MSSPTSPLCGPSTGVVDESVPSVLPEVDITKVRNLVFQGGSVKGVCYGGAVGALHKAFRKRDLHMHSEILNVAGTSAGALTAVAMAVGANVEELVQAMGTTDFKSFLDTKAYEIVESISSDTASTPQKTSAAMATLPLLTSSMGLSSGKGILEFVENFVKGRCGIDHLTFKELHELVLKARDEGQKNGNEGKLASYENCTISNVYKMMIVVVDIIF
jgi:predicted acylesterase/phospholipase RssA